jgi:hypothetical protein
MATGNSRNERIYTMVESTYGVVPNTGGAATVAGSNYLAHIGFQLNAAQAMLVRPSKTGSRTVRSGVGGRRAASWNANLEMLAGSGAGVAPDCDPILRAVFGQAPTVSAGVSVTYNFADTVRSFSAFSFITPNTLMQRIGAGCVAQTASFTLNQDVATWTASGDAKWLIDSVNFATLDTDGRSGLTAFPTEPVSPVGNGSLIAGFTGSLVVDGNTVADLTDFGLTIGAGNATIKNNFGSSYPNETFGDTRSVSCSIGSRLSDVTAITNAITKALSKTAIQIVATVGTVAGNRYEFTVKGVQLGMPSMSDSGPFWTLNFGDSPASGSTLTSLDEVSLRIY